MNAIDCFPWSHSYNAIHFWDFYKRFESWICKNDLTFLIQNNDRVRNRGKHRRDVFNATNFPRLTFKRC